MEKEKLVSISVKVPVALLEDARQVSADTGVTISFIVRKAIERWVKEFQLSKSKETNN